MKSVVDILLAEENRLFYGREYELQWLQKAFHDDVQDREIVHLYGPNGIGKSALLRKFARKLAQEQVSYIQPDRPFLEPATFLKSLVETIRQTYSIEESAPSADFDEVLHLLNRTRLFTASRQPLFDLELVNDELGLVLYPDHPLARADIIETRQLHNEDKLSHKKHHTAKNDSACQSMFHFARVAQQDVEHHKDEKHDHKKRKRFLQHRSRSCTQAHLAYKARPACIFLCGKKV